MRTIRAIAAAVLLVIVSVVVSAGAGASTSQVKATASSPVVTFTSGVTVTPLDPVTMQPSGATRTLVRDSTSHPACPEAGGCISASYYTGGAPSVFGCNQLRVYVHSHTLLGASAYYWNHYTNWCWGFGLVGSQFVWTTISGSDGFHYYRGTGPRPEASTWYDWHAPPPFSGYYSARDAAIENCIPVWGCIGVEYPWTWARVHGNGTYSYDWGYS